MLHRVKEIEYLDGYRLKLRFGNGKVKVVDLAEEMKHAKNLFLDLVNTDYFKKVECDGISISWPNGIDFCPDWLYKNGKDIVQPKQIHPKRRKASRVFGIREKPKVKT